MHLYFFLRGITHQLEMTKIFLQSQYFKWVRINLKTGKEEIKLVQGSLRPTIFGAYEYVFPEEALADVLSMIGIVDATDYFQSKELRLKFLRPIFNCKKIPDKIFKEAAKIPNSMTLDGSWRGLSNCIVGGVAYHVIGIKKDARRVWEEAGYEQEML